MNCQGNKRMTPSQKPAASLHGPLVSGFLFQFPLFGGGPHSLPQASDFVLWLYPSQTIIE